ncbi:uncharacterized protein LOC136073754 isoform X2 [Hydra vulgaris]|uniref:uncharacterized protein LOC136073754 isoform X2 n=1 Tax=Hydra vulgaris TaxID=6087 RepID=UPI0032E9ECE8
MSDAPNQSSDNSSESKIVKKPSFEFLRSPLGIQMAVNILFLNCAIWIILLVISSSIIANEARKYKAIAAFEPDALGAASAFGFFACVGLVIQALLHFREYRSPVLS